MKKLLATAAIAAASLTGVAGLAGTASADTLTSGPVSGSSAIVVDTPTAGTDLTDPTTQLDNLGSVRIEQDSDAVFLTRIADGTLPRTRTISMTPLESDATLLPRWQTMIGNPAGALGAIHGMTR